MMTRDFEPVPLLGEGPSLRADVAAWITSPALSALIESSGGSANGPTDSELRRLDELDAFTERWDTRKGKERDQAGELPITPDQEALIFAAASALGLRDTATPRHATYDHIVMLGGLFRACITRPAYAADLLRKGEVQANMVSALGGHRPFSEAEHSLATSLGFGDVAEEFEALDAGTRRAFDLQLPPRSSNGERSDFPGGSWTLHEYESALAAAVIVAAAPSSDPTVRRANTADSYQWWAREVARLEPGARILAVTTAIYVPAQHAAAIRMLSLPYGVGVDTVGIEPGDVIPGLAQPFSASNYLMEIRSTIRSFRDLLTSEQGL